MGQDFRPAEFWKRAVAFGIDALLIYLLTIVVTFAIYRSLRLPLPGPEALGLLDVAAVLALIMLVGWLYFALTESSVRQASPGKLLVRIMVIDSRGRRLPFPKATARFWLKIFSLLLLLIPFLPHYFSWPGSSDTLVINRTS